MTKLMDSEPAPPCAHASARAREKSLKNFGLVPRCVAGTANGVARSPLSCRSCRRRSWSGWGGMEQRDGIVDLGAETGMKKHERGSDRLRSGSKPNSIGATHNHAIGRMTHSQGSIRSPKHPRQRSHRHRQNSSPLSSGHAVITTTTSPPGFNLITYKRKPTAAPISSRTVHSDSVTPWPQNVRCDTVRAKAFQ